MLEVDRAVRLWDGVGELAPNHDGVGVRVEGQLHQPCFGARGAVIFRPGIVVVVVIDRGG